MNDLYLTNTDFLIIVELNQVILYRMYYKGLQH